MSESKSGKPRKTTKKSASKRTKRTATKRAAATPRAKAKPRAKPKQGAWKAVFLKALEESGGHVGEACRATRVSRTNAYAERKRDEEFAIAWDDAVEYTIDSIQATSQLLALHGSEEPVFWEGAICGCKTKVYPILQMFHLRNRRPAEFNKRVGYGEGTVVLADDVNSAREKAALLIETVKAMVGTVELWEGQEDE